MKPEERTEFETKIVDLLKTVYDPEIPVDIYNLGLIYRIEVTDDYIAEIDMTFTAPTCPAAEFILEDVRQKVSNLEGIKNAVVQLIFEPAWNKDMMSEEAKVDLGLL
ncbi:MAG: iron-sulfur cluster assembly protein [Prevotellaceae bacterium]|nr:iron-sulfur cluster assembly protein [Prevotellaceae bacterium]